MKYKESLQISFLNKNKIKVKPSIKAQELDFSETRMIPHEKMDMLHMSRRIPFLGFFGSGASDDDFADRLNYKYTVAILVVFAFIVTNKHFSHNQVGCIFF